MKRIVSALLCLAMLFAFATVASAEEPATGFTAPKILGVQKGVAYDSDDDGTDDSINLRFVSGLTSLKGERLGYEIKAQFVYQGKGQSVVYQGDDMETDTVYTSILADGEPVTAESQGCVALFALVMEVPVTLDIVFTATAYIKANGEKVAVSETTQFVFSNGEFTERKVILAQDFNDITVGDDCYFEAKTDGTAVVVGKQNTTYKPAIQDTLGWMVNQGGTKYTRYPVGMKKVGNGEKGSALKIHGGTMVDNYTVLPKGTLSNYDAYSIEMDLNINSLDNDEGRVGMVIFALHEKYASADRSNEIHFRLYNSNERVTNADKTGTSKENSWLGMEYNLGTGISPKATKSNLGLTDKGFDQNFHMRVEVDTSAMTIVVFLTPDGGTETQIFSDKMTVVPDGGFMIGIEQTVATIDNLVIRGYAI